MEDLLSVRTHYLSNHILSTFPYLSHLISKIFSLQHGESIIQLHIQYHVVL